MRWMGRMSIAMASLCLAACLAGRDAPRSSIALERLARRGSAVLVLVYPRSSWVRVPLIAPGFGPPGPQNVQVRFPMDVIDERGELVARLQPGSWTALRRPPGAHRLFAVRTDLVGSAPSDPRVVGVLDTELAADRYYYVAIDVHQPDRCVPRPDHPTIDLEAVPTEGWLFDAVRTTLDPQLAYAPVPIGVAFPGASELARRADARLRATCSAPLMRRMSAGMGRLVPLS